jgi:hypothetical protein
MTSSCRRPDKCVADQANSFHICCPVVTLRRERASRIAVQARSAVRKTVEVVVIPVADLLDRTTFVVDLVPLLTAKPWLVSLRLRAELARQGYELPTSWRGQP